MPLFFQLCRPRPLRALLMAAFGLAALGLCFLALSPAASAQAPDPVPAISGISPSSAVAGGPPVTLTVSGTGFASNSALYWNGQFLRPTLVTDPNLPPRLVVTVYASLMTDIGAFPVTVVNPAPGGGTSNPQSFQIIPPIPTPVLTALSPSHVTEGGPDFTLTVMGTGFDSTSRIHISVYPYSLQGLPTTLVSPTQITAMIPATTISSHFSQAIQVLNGVAGINYIPSNSLTLTVDTPPYPVPTLTALSPASVPAGSGGFLLQLAGTGFNQDMTVTFGGARLSGSLVTAGINVFIPDADVPAAAGTVPVTVTSPSSGPGFGGTSNALTFTFTAPLPPAPVLLSVSPDGARRGHDVTLTVTGSGFQPSTQVRLDALPLATTFVSPTTLTATLPASLLAFPRYAGVDVFTSPPGGGTSACLLFTITDRPSPQYLSPAGNDSADGSQGSPRLTLRAAFNAAISGDTILLAAGTYGGPGDTDIDFGSKHLRVGAAGVPGTAVIDGGGHLVFSVYRGAAAILDGLTLQNGAVAVQIGAGGSVALTACTLAGNGASGNGGAISNTGTLALTDCTLSGNHTSYAAGGALYNAPGGMATLTGCTVAGNTMTGNGLAGGGVYNEGALALTNCTLFGNATSGQGNAGGGLFSAASGGASCALTSCTVTGNQSNSGDGVGGAVTVTASIIAGNTTYGGGSDDGGDESSGGGSNLFHGDPGLDPAGLKYSGGPTPTVAVLAGSRAIGGDHSGATRTDQRGVARTAAQHTVSAFEYKATHTRLLWNNADGKVSVWNVNPDGTHADFVYGPYVESAGSVWSATALAEGPDGVLHILWNNTDRRASLWNVGADGRFTTRGTYGPFTDGAPGNIWTATAVAAGS